MPEPRLRWALLSTARITRRLIPALGASGRSEIVLASSRDPARAEAFAREWSIPRATGAYARVLDDPDIDAVYIPLPNALHVEWTIRALEAGKHVLCEKPMALVPSDVDRIAEVAARTRRHVAECVMYRHEPQTTAVLDLLAGGAIGQLRTIAGCFTYPQSRLHDVRLVPALGGGCLWDVGVYPVSLACLLAKGTPSETRGIAVIGPSGVDESFAGLLRFPTGVTAHVDAGFRAISRAWVEVTGDAGVLMIPSPFKPGLREELVLRREDGHQVIVVHGHELPFVALVRDFERTVLDGEPPVVPLAETRRTVAVCRALLESAGCAT